MSEEEFLGAAPLRAYATRNVKVRLHQRRFERILGVAPDYRIHIRRDVLDEHDGPMLRHGLKEMEGQRIVVPAREPLRPNPDYLAERFEESRAA